MRSVGIASILALVLSISLLAQEKYPGPRCLGPFCVDHYDSGTKVFEQLGRPKSDKGGQYCYHAPDNSRFVSLEVRDGATHLLDHVYLSDFQHCLHVPEVVTSADLKNWRTPEGIGLGSSEQEVMRAYGKANYTYEVDDFRYRTLVYNYRPGDRKPDVGTKSLEYRLEDRTRSAEFGIRNGKVAWISMFR